MVTSAGAGRIRTAIAVAVVVAAALLLLVAATRPSAPPNRGLGQVGGAAMEWLRAQAGTTCFQTAIAEFFPGDALANADKLTGTDRWLSDGSRHAFVGEISRAAIDLGGFLTDRSEVEAWIVGWDEDSTPVAYQYEALKTPQGKTLWVLVGIDRPQPEENCKPTT